MTRSIPSPAAAANSWNCSTGSASDHRGRARRHPVCPSNDTGPAEDRSKQLRRFLNRTQKSQFHGLIGTVDEKPRSRLRQILPEGPGRSRGAVQSGLVNPALPRQVQNGLLARFGVPGIWRIAQNSINWKQNTRRLGAPAQEQRGKIARPLKIWVSLLCCVVMLCLVLSRACPINFPVLFQAVWGLTLPTLPR